MSTLICLESIENITTKFFLVICLFTPLILLLELGLLFVLLERNEVKWKLVESVISFCISVMLT